MVVALKDYFKESVLLGFMGDGETKINGIHRESCRVGPEWGEFLDDFSEARRDDRNMLKTMELVLANTGHLTRLPEIVEQASALNVLMQDVKANLIAPATGTGRVPLEVMTMVVKAQNTNARYMYGLLGMVIMGLSAIIGFLLVGERYKVIEPLIRGALP